MGVLYTCCKKCVDTPFELNMRFMLYSKKQMSRSACASAQSDQPHSFIGLLGGSIIPVVAVY